MGIKANYRPPKATKLKQKAKGSFFKYFRQFSSSQTAEVASKALPYKIFSSCSWVRDNRLG